MPLRISPSAFKDCDIRGKYPDEVNESMFTAVGSAFGRQVLERPPGDFNGHRVVVGGDARASTPALKASFLAGLTCHELEIIDLGVVPTNVVYWAKAELKAQACAVITASHNPPEFNGLKVMNGDRPPTPEEIGLLAINGANVEAREVRSGKLSFWPEATDIYMKRMRDLFSGKGADSLSIVVDPGGGCLSGVATTVFRNLGAHVIGIHDRVDGTFQERHPDCAIPEHLTALMSAVVENRADLGIAFDGDGDRIAVVDDLGRNLASEWLGMMLLQGPMKPGEGVPVILDIKCSMHLERLVRELGGRPMRCKSGHAYMKRMVLDRHAILGIELSGHIFYGTLEGRDDPLYTALVLCGYMAGLGQPLSAAVDTLPKLIMTKDVRVPMAPDKIDRILETCRSAFEGATVETLDGVRLVWKEGWLLIRRSITEPKITLRLEGERWEDLNRIGRRFSAVFPELASHVEAAVGEVRV